MEMNVHNITSNQFTNYSNTSVTVNHKEYSSNIVVTNDGVFDFAMANIKEITQTHLAEVLAFKPDLIIFGTGSKVVFPDIEIIKLLQKNNIGYEVMSIQALCRTYNFLISENRKIACILFFNT